MSKGSLGICVGSVLSHLVGDPDLLDLVAFFIDRPLMLEAQWVDFNKRNEGCDVKEDGAMVATSNALLEMDCVCGWSAGFKGAVLCCLAAGENANLSCGANGIGGIWLAMASTVCEKLDQLPGWNAVQQMCWCGCEVVGWAVGVVVFHWEGLRFGLMHHSWNRWQWVDGMDMVVD
eukprot:4575166-Ditylum_brightwellii.AAC.1